jgi:hypothetical protein
MNIANLPAVNDKADFLANAELLVQESLEWYGQLADCMQVHNNPEAAAQFRALENMEQQQLQWIEQQASGLTLPRIAPWDFAWDIYNDPDSNGLCHIDYLTNPARALTTALYHENQAEELYRHVAAQTSDLAVKHLADEMAEQQLGQIKLLQQRLSELPEEAHELVEDIDPPNMPE